MKPTQEELQGRAPLNTDMQLHRVLQFLLTATIQRQIWLFFLDAEQRLTDPIMPMNDHPLDPYELHEIEDLGLVTFPTVFVHRARQIAEAVDAASFVIVWERPGDDKFTRDDIQWAAAFVDQAGGAAGSAPLRALFLLHDRGLRQFAPDDYL